MYKHKQLVQQASFALWLADLFGNVPACLTWLKLVTRTTPNHVTTARTFVQTHLHLLIRYLKGERLIIVRIKCALLN